MITINTILIAVILLFNVLVIGILWQAFRRFSASLHKQIVVLEEATTRLTMHDFSVRVPVLQSRDLQRLGCAFNTMAEVMQQQRDELHILNTALEETNQARGQFFSMMAHELRTPLTAILGFSQLLLRDMEHSESRSRNNVERILKNGHHLLDLINDALDLVKVEAGHMSAQISPVSLPALMNEVIEKTQALGVEKKLLLKTDIASDINEILSDPDMLGQILLNLVSNALKFTEQCEVYLGARWQAETDQEEKLLVISVRDSGIGIAADIQERIFEAFYQGDSSITRKYGGTGLGLAIVRQFTLLLGGTLTLESSPGQGSTFTLLLPQDVNSYTRQSNVPFQGREKVGCYSFT